MSVSSNRVETYQAITKAEEQIYIHDFSYQNNTSYEDKIDEHPSSQGSNGTHIGMLHGTYSKSKIKQRYTEFILEDLSHKLYHYWVLGHIHQRRELSDMSPIHYSGNTQGCHFGEIETKGCLLMEGDHLHLEATFILAQFIRFEETTIKTDKISKQGIYEEVQKFKEQVREQGKAFYRLTINIDNDKILSTQDILRIREMISEYEGNEHDFIVVEDVIFNYIQNEETPLINEFSKELIDDDKVFEEVMTDLYLSPRASKYLEDYTTFNKAKLVYRAEKILKTDMRGEEIGH